MLFTFVKGIGYPSTFVPIQFRQSDPAHRRAANGHALEAFFLFLRADRQNQYFYLSLSATASNTVEMTGFEPVAFALQRRCSPTELHPQAYLLEWA